MPLSVADRQGASWRTHSRSPSHLLDGEGVKGLPFEARARGGPNDRHPVGICGQDALVSHATPPSSFAHDGNFISSLSSEAEYWIANSSKTTSFPPFGHSLGKLLGPGPCPLSDISLLLHLPCRAILGKQFLLVLSKVFSRSHGHWGRVRSCRAAHTALKVGEKVSRPAEGVGGLSWVL